MQTTPRHHVWPYAALLLMVAQVMLILASWLYSAVFPASGVHSLLSGEGLRWLFGHFSDLLATRLLADLVLLSLAWGALRHSGLVQRCRPSAAPLSYRERRALMLALLVLAAHVGVVGLLTFTPHAVLRSATGSLWPSPFSASLVPQAALLAVLLSAVYGMVAGRFATLADVYRSLLSGMAAGAPLFLFYILLIQFCESLLYVMP